VIAAAAEPLNANDLTASKSAPTKDAVGTAIVLKNKPADADTSESYPIPTKEPVPTVNHI